CAFYGGCSAGTAGSRTGKRSASLADSYGTRSCKRLECSARTDADAVRIPQRRSDELSDVASGTVERRLDPANVTGADARAAQ
ncbi:peptide synthetase, partial [Escherichia coli]